MDAMPEEPPPEQENGMANGTSEDFADGDLDLAQSITDDYEEARRFSCGASLPTQHTYKRLSY